MQKHANMMAKHRKIVGLSIVVKSSTGEEYEVPSSVTKVNADDISYDIFKDKQSIKCRILLEDLKAQDIPLTGFQTITYKRQEYVVVNPSVNGGFDDCLILYGVIYGK
ncbi:MAG: hypothetical protein ACRDDY_03940 [Clostridium sp.]|uniref:hypothetical protein n=1 Tax=Clostridium sp. TaxID=1506 RepID=UPI003EE54FD4